MLPAREPKANVARSRARRELQSRHDLCGLIYESAPMHNVVSLAVKVELTYTVHILRDPMVQARRKSRNFVG